MSDEMSDAHLQARQDRQVADPPPMVEHEHVDIDPFIPTGICAICSQENSS